MNSGFPSPAQYYRAKGLDLNTYLIHHPESTFFLRVRSSCYESLQVFQGDLLIIDRNCYPRRNDLVLAIIDGQRRLIRYIPHVSSQNTAPVEIWGTITYVVHTVRAP